MFGRLITADEDDAKKSGEASEELILPQAAATVISPRPTAISELTMNSARGRSGMGVKMRLRESRISALRFDRQRPNGRAIVQCAYPVHIG
jgi:hypothetical protein